MRMIEAMIKGIAEMEIWKKNECYGVFRETPKKKILKLMYVEDKKNEAYKVAEYLNEKCKHKLHYVVRKMTYLLDPKDFIIVEEETK